MRKLTWLPDTLRHYPVFVGCVTELGMTGERILDAVKETFPPNGVPDHILVSLNMLRKELGQTERSIHAFLMLVQKHLDEE